VSLTLILWSNTKPSILEALQGPGPILGVLGKGEAVGWSGGRTWSGLHSGMSPSSPDSSPGEGQPKTPPQDFLGVSGSTDRVLHPFHVEG
jgi:hypothetical protein